MAGAGGGVGKSSVVGVERQAVIDDDGAGPVRLAHGQSDIEVGPGHYATGRADTVCGHPPEEEVGSSGTDIRIEKLGDGRASGCGGIEDLPG